MSVNIYIKITYIKITSAPESESCQEVKKRIEGIKKMKSIKKEWKGEWGSDNSLVYFKFTFDLSLH